MEKFCMALIVIALIVNCQLALSQATETQTEAIKDAPSIPEAVKIATGEGSVDEIKKKAKKQAEETKKDLLPDPIPIPNDILIIMNNAQMKVDFLNKEKEHLEAEIRATNLQIEKWNVTKMVEYWFHLADNGVKKKDYRKWIVTNGVARYRK